MNFNTHQQTSLVWSSGSIAPSILRESFQLFNIYTALYMLIQGGVKKKEFELNEFKLQPSSENFYSQPTSLSNKHICQCSIGFHIPFTIICGYSDDVSLYIILPHHHMVTGSKLTNQTMNWMIAQVIRNICVCYQ